MAETSAPPPWMIWVCPEHGPLTWGQYNVCRDCNKTGIYIAVVPTVPLTIVCPACKGQRTEAMVDHRSPCFECQGSGQVPNPKARLDQLSATVLNCRSS